MGKSSKIRHIVRLRQMLRRWRHRAAAVPEVPAGHVAVCVGSSSRRFVVRASHLNHPVFRKLLRQAEEEYGFSRPGPLSIPCDESLFEHILRHITSSSSSSLFANLDDFQSSLPCDESLFEHIVRHITSSSSSSSSSLFANLYDFQNSLCCCHVRSRHAADSFPLLHSFAEKSVW